MKIKEIASVIEKYAPRENAYEWDNVGMMLGDPEAECTGVLVCLDCTFAAALQARDEGCNLIVSHHPFIFRPLDRLTLDDPKAKMVRFLFRNNIAVYSAHTNLDVARGRERGGTCAQGVGRARGSFRQGEFPRREGETRIRSVGRRRQPREPGNGNEGRGRAHYGRGETSRLHGGGRAGLPHRGVLSLLQRNNML